MRLDENRRLVLAYLRTQTATTDLNDVWQTALPQQPWYLVRDTLRSLSDDGKIIMGAGYSDIRLVDHHD